MRLTEIHARLPILYHGTCSDSADALCATGWHPGRWSAGGNGGQRRYLYLSTGYEDALWFAQEKGCDIVVMLTEVPPDSVIVDPEDGIGDDVWDEIARNAHFGMPGKLALTKPLGAAHFRLATPS